MPHLTQALFTVALLSTALVAAAPTAQNIAKKPLTLKEHGKTIIAESKGKLRRGKRQVILEEVPEVDDEEEIIRSQLAELSDNQLAILADIVQAEIDKFSPEEPLEQYEIINIPDELLESIELAPRDRRSTPVIVEEIEEEEPEMEEEIIAVPEEVLEEALAEQQDDMELRMRIAEMAGILNERASRRIQIV